MPNDSEVMACLQYAAESQSGLDAFSASGNFDTEEGPCRRGVGS